MIRIAVADDHPTVRLGVVTALSRQSDMLVVGEAADGLDALALVKDQMPDVLVLDLMMPGLSGLEVSRRVQADCPATGVVILTLHTDEALWVELLSTGASAVVSKDAAPSELVRAVRAAHQGMRTIPAAIRVQRGSDVVRDPWSTLTAREREVAQQLAEGGTNADVGDRLGISHRTVEVHRAAIYKKLHLAGLADLVRLLVRRGILSPQG